ncbi:UNVERIFIED_CONTAM: hypothetical protein HDU68_012534 [Siphonaria sp. JEL0065]|nr:hypothetical protein HDU68_012534 [Siphonaria sp. JEL0065]
MDSEDVSGSTDALSTYGTIAAGPPIVDSSKASNANENKHSNQEDDDSDQEILNDTARAKLAVVVPWKHLKPVVYGAAGLAVGAKRRDLEEAFGGNNGDDGVERFRKQFAASSMVPTTIPYGFQNTRSITHPRPSLKTVLYTAVSKLDSFLACDAHFVVAQKGSSSKTITMSIDPEKRGQKKNAANPESPFLGLSRWIFIPKWKITVIATLQLELKVLLFVTRF